MTRIRRIASLGAAAACVVAVVLVPAAHADTPSIGGFQMTATADAVSLIYDQPSFGVPAPHTFELHKSHATTAIDSGPTGHALASIVWPGDVYGSAGLTLALGIFVQDPTSARYLDCSGDPHPCVPLIDNLQTGANQLATNIQKGCNCNPSYPFKSQAYYPQGPKDNKYAAGGGVDMTTHADQSVTQATSTLQEAGFPNAFTIGAMRSTSLSGIVDGQAVSQADSFVSDVDLAGVLHIGQIHSTMQVVSDGVKTTVTKSQSIIGMAIGPQAVTVDSTGLHAGGQAFDPIGIVAKQLINQYLAPNGISLEVQQPVVTKSAGQASATGAGVVITMSAQGMQLLVSKIPQPYRGWLQAPGTSPLSPVLDQFSTFVQGLVAGPTQFDQTFQIRLGDVSVATAAAPAYVPLPPPAALPVAGGAVPPGGAPAPAILPPPSSGPTQLPSQVGSQPLAITPVAAVAVPIGLLLLALAWMVLGATGLDKLATRATSSVVAESCPLEKQ